LQAKKRGKCEKAGIKFQPLQNRRAYEGLRSLPPLSESQELPDLHVGAEADQESVLLEAEFGDLTYLGAFVNRSSAIARLKKHGIASTFRLFSLDVNVGNNSPDLCEVALNKGTSLLFAFSQTR